MKTFKSGATIGAILLLMIASRAMAGGSGNALSVQCGSGGGLNSINAALKQLQYSGTRGPTTINVSGACHENVVIQGLDRLTLNAVNGASIPCATIAATVSL